MKKLLLLFLLNVLSGLLQAQQWQPTTGVYGGYVTQMAASGDTVFAGTYESGLFRSTDSGSTWALDDDTRLHANINNITILNSTTVVAGFNGMLYSTDYGNSWQHTGLYAITALAAGNNQFYAGAYNGVLYSSPDGINWTTLTTIANYQVLSLLIDGSTIYAGLHNGGVYRSTDGGNSFSDFNNGFPPQQNVSTMALTTHGTTVFAATHWGIYSLPQGQSTWIVSQTGIQYPQSPQALVSDGTTLYVGTAFRGVFRSDDNGANWYAINNGITTNNITELIIHNSVLYAGSEGGGVFISSDAGVNWAASNNGFNAALTTSLVYDGVTICAGTWGAGIFVSTDNGYTWQSSNTGLTNYEVIDMTWNGTLLFAGTRGGGIFTSSDHGNTWVQANNGLTNPVIASLASHAGEVFAGTQMGNTFIPGTVYASLFKSVDNGNTWTELDSGMENEQVFALAFNEPYMYAGTLSNGVYVSDNMGENWYTVQDAYPASSIYALAANGQRVFAGTNANGLFVSTDNCNTWSPANSGFQTNVIRSLAVNNNTIYAGTITFGNAVYTSDNNGVSWTGFSTGLPTSELLIVNDFEFTEAAIFTSLWGSGVWMYDTPVTINEEDNSFEMTIYPNPATTTITIQSMVNSPWSVVNIYSAQGTLVLTTTNIINQTLNIENLSTGLYYLTLQSAEGTATKKFEVIK